MMETLMAEYVDLLNREERSEGTIEKYARDVTAFAGWLGDRPLSREMVRAWKDHLLAEGYEPATINSMLAAVNRWLRFLGQDDCRTKYIRVQRKIFLKKDRNLTKQEYEKLVNTARESGQERLALILETICATGIRVSELKYITLDAAQKGSAEISLKGKNRVIMMPGKLCRKLQKYAKKQKIASGELFVTRNGNSLSRKQIWAEMKALCGKAGVEPSKVFPHNLRHLFARTFYKSDRDIVKLADILGHSCIETTRIYLISTGEEHLKRLNRLDLVL